MKMEGKGKKEKNSNYVVSTDTVFIDVNGRKVHLLLTEYKDRTVVSEVLRSGNRDVATGIHKGDSLHEALNILFWTEAVKE